MYHYVCVSILLAAMCMEYKHKLRALSIQYSLTDWCQTLIKFNNYLEITINHSQGSIIYMHTSHCSLKQQRVITNSLLICGP